MRPRRFAHLCTLAVAGGLVLGAAPARAQPAAQPPNKEAVEWFNKGRALREKAEKDKDHPDLKLEDQAREAFEASIKAQRTIGALYNLAACHEVMLHHRQAIDYYEQAQKAAHEVGDPRDLDAAEAKAQILRQHSWVKVHVVPLVAELEELKIVVDGEPITPAEFDTEVFHDRPTHTVVVTAKNRATFRPPPVKDHGTQDVKLEDLPSTVVASGGGTPPAGEGPGPATHSGGWGWPQWTGLAAIVVGAGVAGIGAIQVIGAKADQNDAGDLFTSNRCADPDARQVCIDNKAKFDDAKSRQLSNALIFGVPALVLVAGGIVLIVEGPSITGNSGRGRVPNDRPGRFAVNPLLGPSGGGMSLTGTF